MTLLEQTKTLKQATELITSVMDDMMRSKNNDSEAFRLLQEAHTNSRKAYFELKRKLWKQPLGVK